MSLIWNNNISISYFGEAQNSVVGITISGLPTGEFLNSEEIGKFLNRLSVKCLGEKKVPMPRIMSGISNDRTTGAPLCAFLKNEAVEVAEETEPLNFRYGHGDYTGAVCNRGYCDTMKNSQISQIFNLPLAFAGAVCGQILERRGIYTGSHIAQIHNIKDNPFDVINLSRDAVLSVRFKDFPVINDKNGWLMLNDMEMAQQSGETLGGIVECASINVPSGVGSPVFNGLANNIAQLLFTIPDVVGVEFGAGFSSASMVGSQYSDPSYITEKGYSMTKTNSHGGMINGISSGMPITLKTAFKPVRADSKYCCTVPQSVVYVESAVNIGLLSAMLDYPNFA